VETLTNDIELIFRRWQTRDMLVHHHWKEKLEEASILGGEKNTPMKIEFFSTPHKNWEDDENSFSSRWCADRSAACAPFLCEWFGITRCAAIFLTRESSLLKGWSTSAHASPQDKARASTALSALLLAATNCGIKDLPLFGVVIPDATGSSRFGPYDVVCGFMHRNGKITTMECDQRNQVTLSYPRTCFYYFTHNTV
jgi:hypothetical protein